MSDCAATAASLAELIGASVTAAYLSAVEPRLANAVAQQRLPADSAQADGDDVREHRPARVVVATYLLAPGFFADLAVTSGADVVTPPLLLPDEPPAQELVDIVVERYLS